MLYTVYIIKIKMTTGTMPNSRVHIREQRITARSRSDHLLPLAVILISSGWIFRLHIYLPPDRQTPFWILIIGAFLVLCARVFYRSREPWTLKLIQPRWSVLPGILACAVAVLIFPSPYQLGAVVLGFGWILLSLTRSLSFSRYLALAVTQIGLLLLVSAGLLPLVYAVAARVHELGGPAYFFTPLSGWVLKLLGQPVALIGGSLFLTTFENLYPQTVTLEKLLPLPLLVFSILWSVLIILRARKQRWERLLFFWVILSLYAVVRLAVLLLIMIQRVNPSYFWEPIPLTLSLLPIAFLVREPTDPLKVRKPIGIRSLQRPPGKTGLILGMLLGVSLMVGLTFQDPGTARNGRLMINEHGSDWEWTTEPMDTVVYNEKTTYNYYCLAEYLKYYYDVRINEEKLSDEVLDGVDVLILKIPTQPYEPGEIDAVVRFVENGGGVWVIGDHTNVFGSSSYFNPLLERFGCRLHYNSTHDLKTGKLTLWNKPPMFAHPSVVNLPPYLFATSCTVSAPLSADGAIIGYGLRVDKLDYSQKNFFPDRSRKLFDIGFGLYLQQVALTKGRGRLLIYTDSTTFSNFFMFIRGKPELALGSVEWLNRNNRAGWINGAGLLAALLFVGLLSLIGAWNGASLAGFLIALSLTGWAMDNNTRSHYPLPEAKRDIPWINFEREHSSYFLPTLRLTEEGDKDYLTFFVWTQRVGAVPREVVEFDEAITSKAPMVMIDPSEPLDETELAGLRDYVKRGGNLLLVNSSDNFSDAPKQIAETFDLQLTTELCLSDTLHTLTLGGRFFPLRLEDRFTSVEGGEPFLWSDQGDVIGTMKAFGEGRVWVITCGHLFRTSGMGPTTVVPDEGLKALYRIEYDLILNLLGEKRIL